MPAGDRPTAFDIFVALVSELPFSMTPEAAARFRHLFLLRKAGDGLVADILATEKGQAAIEDLRPRLAAVAAKWSAQLDGQPMGPAQAESMYAELVSGTILCEPVT